MHPLGALHDQVGVFAGAADHLYFRPQRRGGTEARRLPTYRQLSDFLATVVDYSSRAENMYVCTVLIVGYSLTHVVIHCTGFFLFRIL